MENLKNKYRFITHEKELNDTKKLADIIRDSKWLKPDTLFVNCFPEYTSRLTQFLNHSLSFLNKDELFDVVDLSIPIPSMNQVWDRDTRNFRHFSSYLSDWVRMNMSIYETYLFICLDSDTINLHKINSLIKGRVDSTNYRFATLYKEKNNILNPDFYTEEYDQTLGKLAFQWENLNNPNK